jgi:hypothetical protein
LNAAIAMLLASTLSVAGAGDEQLLAGARHFREGRYGDALIAFRVADALGAEGARGYAAVSLVKLDRFEEALEVFDGVPESADALLSFYRALACYGARLYVCADEILKGLGDRGGPKITAEVASLRRDIEARRAQSPADDLIAGHARRCAELRAQKRAALADAYCRESAALGARRAELSRTSVGPNAAPAGGER